MDRFSQDQPSLAAHKAAVYGDEEKHYCAVCDSTHYAPICEPEPEEETGCTPEETCAPEVTYRRIEARPAQFVKTAQGKLFGGGVA